MVARIPIAVAALVRDGLVLLVHRHPLRQWYPDCWDLVGGHVEPGESPREAVIRECFEELGADPGEAGNIASTPILQLELDAATKQVSYGRETLSVFVREGAQRTRLNVRLVVRPTPSNAD